MLIGKQSIDQVTDALRHTTSHTPKKAFVASISPQTLASLSVRYARTESGPRDALSLELLLDRISRALHTIGFDAVGDTTFARELALREHVREFHERKAKGAGAIPMLAGSCPGWVCYAEKAQAELLPYVSTSKSPQQVAGLLAKLVIGRALGRAPADVYHVTVMPCYDKKLEASRPDNAVDDVPEVDCVITTGELHDLLLTQGFDPYAETQTIHKIRTDEPASSELAFPRLLAQPGGSSGGSSGGYLFAVMQDVWKMHPDAALETREIRSSDYTEYTLRVHRGEESSVVFKGAVCYGFRNLQNLVRKVQRETGVRGRGGRGLVRRVRGGDDTPYDHVEVMACPGGCANGGGQMRPPRGTVAPDTENDGARAVGWQGTSREWVKLVDDAYWTGESGAAPAAPCALDAFDAQLDGHMRTVYHGVQPETNGLAVQW